MTRPGDKPKPPKCALGKLVKTDDTEAMKRGLWRQYRQLVVSLDDPRLSWPDRELLMQIGEHIYGIR